VSDNVMRFPTLPSEATAVCRRPSRRRRRSGKCPVRRAPASVTSVGAISLWTTPGAGTKLNVRPAPAPTRLLIRSPYYFFFGAGTLMRRGSPNEIRVPTCRSAAEACPEGQGCGAAAAALVSYVLFVPLPRLSDARTRSRPHSLLIRPTRI
jgi:hypothetical protein